MKSRDVRFLVAVVVNLVLTGLWVLFAGWIADNAPLLWGYEQGAAFLIFMAAILAFGNATRRTIYQTSGFHETALGRWTIGFLSEQFLYALLLFPLYVGIEVICRSV